MKLLAYSDFKSVPNRSLTIMDYMGATYVARGPKVANDYAKFNKLCDYALSKVKDGARKRSESAKIDGAAGSGKMVRQSTAYAREAD